MSPAGGSAVVLAPEVHEVLASAAGGDRADAADVPDDRWQGVPAFGLIAPSDRQLLPDGAVDAFPMSRQQAVMVAQMTMGAARRRRRPGWVPPYHNVATFSLTVPHIEAGAFVEAGEVLVQRHEMLRSILDVDTFSCPMQVVLGEAARPLVEVVDLRGTSREVQRAELARFAEAQNAMEIDLRRPPLVSVTIHLLGDAEVALTITEPHAIADGWSTHLNVVELLERASGARAGTPGGGTEEPVAFRLRAHSAQQLWQQRSEEDMRWWRTRLSNVADPPAGRQDGDPHTWDDAIEIAGEAFASLVRLGQRLGAGLKSVLLAVHLRALGLVTGDGAALTGVTVNTRLAVPDGVDARGMFLNVVPLHAAATTVDDASVIAAHHELMQVTARGRIPLADIAQQLGRGAVPTSLFVFNSFHSIAGAANRLGIDTLEAVEDWSHTDFPLEASFNRSEEAEDTMTLLLFSELSPHPSEPVLRAYRAALHDFGRLGRESSHA